MAYRCDLCGKKSYKGRSRTHHTGVAGGQWKKRAQVTKRTFAPNLHWVTLPFGGTQGKPFGGVMRRVRACTKCIKRIRFDLERKQQLNENNEKNKARILQATF